MFSFVHNRNRNRLAAEKAETLVYIYTNSRVLRQRPGADPVRWYNLNNVSEDSDPDALGPVPAHEENRVFDAMLASEEEEANVEANRPPPPPHNPNQHGWGHDTDHRAEARNYYGEANDMEDDNAHAAWRSWSPIRRNHRRSAVAGSQENEGGNEDVFDFPVDDDETLAQDVQMNDVDNHDNIEDNIVPSQGNAGNMVDENAGNQGNDQNDIAPNNDVSTEDGSLNMNGIRGGGTTITNGVPQGHSGGSADPVRRTEGIERSEHTRDMPRVFNVQRVRDALNSERVDRAHTQSRIPLRSAELREDTIVQPRRHSSPNISVNPVRRLLQEGLGAVGDGNVVYANASSAGTLITSLEERVEPIVGDYRGRGSNGRGGRNSNRGRGESGRRATKRPHRGIGARLPGEVILPFVQTYTPGPTSSTPAFVVPGTVRGPNINSDAEDPHARKHKMFRLNRVGQSRVMELRNENSEFEVPQTDEDEGGRSEDDADGDDEGEDDRVEAPDDDDVLINHLRRAGPSNQPPRRSSRFRDVGGEEQHVEPDRSP